MKKLQMMIQHQWTITENGKLIPFADFLKESVQDGISTHYLADQLQETLEAAAAPDAEWSDVVDYIAPIAGYILSEAVETDRELYNELVITLTEAFAKLRVISKSAREAEEAAERVYTMDRENTPEFFYQFDELIKDLASGEKVIKEFDNQQAGCYRVVVGKE